MTAPSSRQSRPSASGTIEAEESLLRALFAALPDAMAEPRFGVAFAHYLRRRMQRLHPPGERDVRAVRSRAGLSFSIDLGDRFASEIYYGQFAEPFDLALMAALTEPGSTMVDVGANFGLYAVTCGQKTAPDRGGHVIAIEPAPSVLPLLRENIARNGLDDRIEVMAVCAGEADGEVSFNVAAEASLSGISATGRSPVAEVITVPMRSLSSIMRERGRDRLDLLKVDAEGHEHAVLRGALPLLQAGSTIAMIEVSAKNLDDGRRRALRAVLDELYASGYLGRWLDPAEGTLRPAETPQAASGLTSANLFLCRRDSDEERRLLDAAGGIWADTAEAPFVPLASPAVDAEYRAGLLTGYGRDRALMLAIHLQSERERNVDLSERLAEREWLERGMQRIAGSEQRLLDEIRKAGTRTGAETGNGWLQRLRRRSALVLPTRRR